MFDHRIFLTRTGEPLGDVDVSSGDWRRSLGDGGGSHGIPDDDDLRGIIGQLTEPNRCSFAVVAPSGQPVYAGVILTDQWADGVTTVQHNEGPWDIFKNRGTFGVGGFPIGGLSISNRGPEGALRAILARATGADGVVGPNWSLPIDLPANTAGSISRTWKANERLSIADLLGQLVDMGYQIDFRPYITAAGVLRYAPVIASRLSGETFSWPISTPLNPVDTPVTDVTWARDGRNQVTGVFLTGKGKGEDMPVGEAQNVAGPDIPVRDATESTEDINDVAALTAGALSFLQKNRAPREQISFSVEATTEPDGSETFDVAAFQPGARVVLDSYGHFRIPDGQSIHYVVSVAGGVTRTLKPEVQPV